LGTLGKSWPLKLPPEILAFQIFDVFVKFATDF
jgi:hypothetical protein